MDNEDISNSNHKSRNVLSCKVVEEGEVSKGFGFVQFDSEELAMVACAALHDTLVHGRKLRSTKYSTSNISNKDLNYGNYWGLKATTSHKKESIKSGSLGSSAQRSLATATTL
ncbi:hypothetical protein Q3G72_015282 [Acer saccharum]|nr:hypothetical protein Q3G72_015282 [Acer saccharum]